MAINVRGAGEHGRFSALRSTSTGPHRVYAVPHVRSFVIVGFATCLLGFHFLDSLFWETVKVKDRMISEKDRRIEQQSELLDTKDKSKKEAADSEIPHSTFLLCEKINTHWLRSSASL